MRPAIETVIFDLGNVLALHDNDLLLRRLAQRAGTTPQQLLPRLDRSLWERIHRGKLPGEKLREELCRRVGQDIPSGEFFELWSCHFTIHRQVLPTVEGLLGRVKLVLLSNTNELHWRFLRPRLPLLERFDHLLLSHELGLSKPEPAIYLRALELAGVEPAQAAFFDDLPEYVEAACRLGILGKLFLGPAQLRADLAQLGL